MEGSGSSNSQIIAQIGLALEETLEEIPRRSQLAVPTMNLPVLALT